MFDIIAEIVGTIRRNKMRTALTGFAVAWGIFILIVLLGSGNGLIHAFEKNVSGESLNVVTVYPGSTTKPYDGLKEGRYIKLENSDLEVAKNSFPDNVEDVGAMLYQNGATISYGAEYVSEYLSGSYPNEKEVNGIIMTKGRFINDIDIRERRKVVVISSHTEEVLFKGADGIGNFVNIGDNAYKVVGIYKEERSNGNEGSYIPLTTMQLIYGKGNKFDRFYLTTKGLDTEEANDAFEVDLRSAIAGNHRFAPDDDGAVWMWNRLSQYMQVSKGMNMLTVAIWIIGIFTLMSGIVGVSNIMLITVKERTREFGIRKALGAKPRSILALVLAESIAITTFFGYIGMVAGIGVTELASTILGDGAGAEGSTTFVDPTVDLSIAVEATLALIIAGTIAGFIPARKAVKVRPIEALRAD